MRAGWMPSLFATADLSDGAQTLDLTRTFARWTPGRAEEIARGEANLSASDLEGAETMAGEAVDPRPSQMRGADDGAFAAKIDAYLDAVGGPETVACHLSGVDARRMELKRRRKMRDALDSECVAEMERPTWLLHHEPTGNVVEKGNVDTFIADTASLRTRAPHGPFVFWACATAPWPGVLVSSSSELAMSPDELLTRALEPVGGAVGDVVAHGEFVRFFSDWQSRKGVRDGDGDSAPNGAADDPELRAFLEGWNAKQTLYAWRPDRTRAFIVGGDLQEGRFEWRREVARQAASVQRAKASFTPGRRLRPRN